MAREPGVVLSELHTDETYGVKIGITKQVRNTIIDKTTLGNPQFDIPTVPSGSYIDVQALNKMRSITLCSRLAQTQTELDALQQVIPGTIDFQWPGTLREINFHLDLGFHTESASGTFTSVTVGGQYNFSGGVGIDIEDGPRSKSVSELTRSFHIGIPALSTTITKIQTSSGAVVIQGGTDGHFTTYTNGPGEVDDITHSSNYQSVSVPSCLTNGVSITNVGLGQAVASLDMSPSIPTVINTGTQIVANIEITQWRFGVFVREITRVTRP